MSVAFQSWQQDRQQGLQALAADSIGGLPHYDQGAAGCLVIKRWTVACLVAICARLTVQYTDRRLLVIAGAGNKLIQDFTLLLPCSRPITKTDSIGEFSPHSMSHLPVHSASRVGRRHGRRFSSVTF